MSDSANVIGKFTEEVEQTTNEVGKEVKDAVGEMIEQGVQSVAGPKLTPQQIQPFDDSQGKQKQAEDQKKLAKVRRDLKWYQNIAAGEKKLMEEAKQKKLQKQQSEEQEKQQKKLEEEEKKRKIIISPAKKTPAVPGQPAPVTEEIARTRQEISKGHGVGG